MINRKERKLVGWRVFKCRNCSSLYSYKGVFASTKETQDCPCYGAGWYSFYKYGEFWGWHRNIPEELKGQKMFEELPRSEVRLMRILYG